MTFSPFQWYRRWEGGYLAAIDALSRGEGVPGEWGRPPLRRWMIQRLSQFTPTDLAQLRSLMWHLRGIRGVGALVAIAIGNTIIGLLVWTVAPQKFGPIEAVVAVNLISFGLLIALMSTWFNAPRLTRLGPRFPAAIVLLAASGACVGALVGMLQSGEPLLVGLARVGRVVLAVGVLVGFAYAGVVSLIATLRNRELSAVNAQLLAQTERERIAHQLARSQLTLLQAQIEPHFLFNTLGAVRQMSEEGAPEASRLTDNLIHFLRGALTELRRSETTLGEEVALAQNYLEIMQARLGQRLQFCIDVPAPLHGLKVTPTLIITLVENAIKHGIEPLAAGGTITLRARTENGQLEITVEDTGAGMVGTPGSGVGLANLRQQLELAYGAQARLELDENVPHGFVARIALPLAERP